MQLADKPVATYTGQVAGLAATKPADGQRLNVDAADVQNYINYLDTKQADVMSTVAGAQITHEYKVVFNGFAALLTDAEVRALKKNAGVANIAADSVLQLDTNYTPSFLGLDEPGGEVFAERFTATLQQGVEPPQPVEIVITLRASPPAVGMT